jgi:hypothetical protein
MTERVYKRAVDLMEAELGDEIVALNVDDGNCFGFNPVAASVWRALSTPRSSSELQAILLDEFDVPPGECASELEALLDDLVAKKLIQAQDRPASG